MLGIYSEVSDSSSCQQVESFRERYFSLYLEIVIAKAAEDTLNVLSNQIVQNPTRPSLFHSELDNFDQLINDLTGMRSVHTVYGIMMQEVNIS